MSDLADLDLQVRRLDVRDGDVLVLSTLRRLSLEVRERLVAESERVREWLAADVKFVVLDDGLTLSVLSRAVEDRLEAEPGQAAAAARGGTAEQ